MIKYQVLLISILFFSTTTDAEFNIENNVNQPTYIKQGYRNVLNSSFIYSNVGENIRLKEDVVNVPYKDVVVILQPLLVNDNKIKGSDYYFLNYELFVQLENVKCKLPFIVSDVAAIGASILFNDNNVVVFSIESYTNPVSNNNFKKFKSDIFVLNKSNLGLYVPSFLTLNKKIQKLNDVPMDFSKLVSIEYNKKQKSYHIVYEIQKALEDFSSTGRVVYEKNPIEYSLILIPDQKKTSLKKRRSLIKLFQMIVEVECIHIF